MREIYDRNYAVKPHSSWVSSSKDQDGSTVYEGYLFTEFGAVGFYTQGSRTYKHSTHLRFLYGDRVYTRTISERYTQRGLVTVAKRFAREMYGALRLEGKTEN